MGRCSKRQGGMGGEGASRSTQNAMRKSPATVGTGYVLVKKYIPVHGVHF